ncbi:MAG: hypothetical protein V4708_08610 [Bacteroidota bacterium]
MSFYKKALRYPIVLLLIFLQVIGVVLVLIIPLETIDFKLYDTYYITTWDYLCIRTLITSVLLFIGYLAVGAK